MTALDIFHIAGVLVFVGIGYATWKQIPAEDPEVVKARKEYGTAE